MIYIAYNRLGSPGMSVQANSVEDRLLKLQLRLAQLERQESCRENFLDFVGAMWPDFISGRHHRIIAEKLERVARGELKRLIINMAPRHTKSEFASFLFPAWMMGKNPAMKIIQATHTTELAVNFGRKTKNLIDSDDFKTVFPEVKLAADSKASGRWDTSRGGMYYAVGVGSNLAGRGGDLVIIDDPHSEQTAMSSSGFEDAWDWYTGGPRQRLQPGGSIVLVQTRWSEKDMTGQLMRAMAKDDLADQWEVVELPAIFEDGTPCWPEFWSLEDLTAVRASIPPSKWNAQYQQNPTGEENAIIKREWWRMWEKESVPQLEYVIQSYDTAFSKRETADYSAITTWGVFYPNEGGSGPNLILLDSKKGRWEFPELKAIALEEYEFWDPDTVIVEAKASGLPLTHELRSMGIPVVNFTPSRGNDKVTRVHSVSPLFEAGMVWAPDKTFADEMIEEVAAFPNGEHDDLVDSMTQALMRYRQGNFVQLPTDDWQEGEESARIRAYY
jgi:predicted phage terminase large subunit-like protein